MSSSRKSTTDPHLPLQDDMLCRICGVQIQLRQYVLVHARYTAPNRQHEVDHTTSGTDLPCLADFEDDELGIDDRSDVWIIRYFDTYIHIIYIYIF